MALAARNCGRPSATTSPTKHRPGASMWPQARKLDLAPTRSMLDSVGLLLRSNYVADERTLDVCLQHIACLRNLLRRRVLIRSCLPAKFGTLACGGSLVSLKRNCAQRGSRYRCALLARAEVARRKNITGSLSEWRRALHPVQAPLSHDTADRPIVIA